MYHDTGINYIYKPVFISKERYADKDKFLSFIEDYRGKTILDLFASQKKELIRIRNPRKRLTAVEVEQRYTEWAVGREADTEGHWIYYPWSERLLHVVAEDEFIELRTSRNQYKITPAEQQELSRRSIGIIGLSVGHSVALSIATERGCGKLKLADFDTIELSNLNRIRTGLHNIGINKCIVTAREIAEIDPFLTIECFTEGINKENLDGFLLDGGKLDILVDECDDMALKISCRVRAAQLAIPVVMETSDRGMLDVERFDHEPERPIFHGLLEGLPLEKFEQVPEEQRLPLVLRIVNAVNASKRGKVSLVEMGQSIGTWPQLASAVTLGGGVVADVCRRILLNQFSESGRYYVDLEELIGNKPVKEEAVAPANPFEPFDVQEAIRIADSLTIGERSEVLNEADLKEIVNAACYAPSTGNDQPWKWLYRNGRLHLFHDRYRSYSFGDFDQIASNISFGAAYENLVLKSNELGLHIRSEVFPLGQESTLIAVITFTDNKSEANTAPVFSPQSVSVIFERTTNRNPSTPVPVSAGQFEALRAAAESVEGARLHYFDDREQMKAIAEIIGECDRIRLLNPNGHRDFVHREMKWSPADAENSRDGIDIRTLGMSSGQMAALSIIRDEEVVKGLKVVRGGGALIDVARITVNTASALGMITMPKYDYKDFFWGGVAMQRLWLKAEELEFAVHPLISPFYLFPRVTRGHGADLDETESLKLLDLREKFMRLVPFEDNIAEVFLFKIASAPRPEIKSYRLPLEETLFIKNRQ
ncbi:ThiF family protein [Dyadobacter sp. SG02]|uniref:Rv1355c family protein n=1 Tax=Dyadobacter sp. SG02 TaxID=1855291 RepID=UPI0008B101C6|nr:Rv1355c family protein [Dyadobacter sp. SG02]SEJ15055.1 ThiF family protein [Dyadobacter sp. SG02]